MDQLHHAQSMAARMLRSVQKPPSKPWRAGTGAGLSPAPRPPKVYRVEPREFRDLVQRLTGAPAAAAPARHHQHVALVQPVPARAGGGGEDAARQMYASPSAPWCSFPLVAPAPMHPGLDGPHLV